MPILGNPLSIGGGSSYKLLASQDYTVNTTSTSATSIGTIDLDSAGWTSDKIIYVRVRDKAGPRNGYFVGSDTFFFNFQAASGSTSSLSVRMCIIHRQSGSSSFTSYATNSNTGYGVYARNITSGGVVEIYRRYNSTYSPTIHGTYNVKIYALDYCPDQGNPFDYSSFS